MFVAAASFVTCLLCLLVEARPASAQAACDAGAACFDGDGDGFMPCACAPAGIACDCNDFDPTVFPGAPERCDGPTDKSCNGVVDACGAKTGCFGGACVPECVPLDDFGCITGSKLTTIGGRCPSGEICRGEGCVDPCAGIACPNGAACVRGVCLPGECADTTCAGIACAAGSHCERGTCVADCTGVVCPPERVCRSIDAGNGRTRGACLDLCTPDPCPIDRACDWRNAACIPKPTREGGLLEQAEERDLLFVAGSGWTCDVGRAAGLSASGGALGALLLLALRIRRRRRQ